MPRSLLCWGIACFAVAPALFAQQSDQETIQQLMQRLADSERRIQALEEKLGMSSTVAGKRADACCPAVAAIPPLRLRSRLPRRCSSGRGYVQSHAEDMQGHNMQIPAADRR